MSVCLSCLSVMLVYCGQTVAWIKMKLGWEVGLGPSHIVLDGDPALPPQKGHSPQFSAHVCCGQTARWIKMPLGTEVDLGPGNIVLDGDPAPPLPKKGTQHPQIWPTYCGQTAGWIKMPLHTEVDLGPDVRWGAAPSSGKGHSSPPSCRSMSIVAKQSPSQLVLSSCC